MLSWFSKICWPLASGVSFNVLYLIFECVPLPPPPPPHDPTCPFVSKYFSHIHTTYQSGILGQGGGWEQGQQSKKNAEKFLNSLWKMILAYVRSINCTNVSIHGCNCCKIGIEVSKCVYLACMAVKIEHTVGGHNHDILQQCISYVYASQVWASTRVKIAKIYAFVHRNLFACTENQ